MPCQASSVLPLGAVARLHAGSTFRLNSAASAGFIGRRLCPELVFAKPDFQKYSKAAQVSAAAPPWPVAIVAVRLVVVVTPISTAGNTPRADCCSPCCFQETRAVFRRYDPDFQAGSLDEAYMDVTDYCQQHGVSGVLHCFTLSSSQPHNTPSLYANTI